MSFFEVGLSSGIVGLFHRAVGAGAAIYATRAPYTGFGKESDADVSLFFVSDKPPLSLENLKCDKPRVRAEPDEPKAPYASVSGSPMRFRIDSLHSITIL